MDSVFSILESLFKRKKFYLSNANFKLLFLTSVSFMTLLALASLSVKSHESASSDLVAMNISYWIDSDILKQDVVWQTRDLRATNF